MNISPPQHKTAAFYALHGTIVSTGTTKRMGEVA
jgi:hypothetical protein